MSDIEILFPEPVKLMVGRREVEIRPVRLRHLKCYGEQAGALIELFAGMGVQQINRYAVAHSGDIKRLLLNTTSLQRWQLWFMPSTVAVQLVAQVVRVNSGFFGEALPAMARALGGPVSPSGSSGQGTA